MGGGGGFVGSTAWMSNQLYSEGDGRIYTYTRYRNERYYLDHRQMMERADMARRFGDKVRIRVRARRQPWSST